MADWTINSGSNPKHYRSRTGNSTPVIRYFQEATCASTAVIKYGDIVSNDTVVTTGGFRIVRAPFNGGTTGGAGFEPNLLNTTNVVGVAVEASTSDGSTAGLTNGQLNQAGNRMIGVAIAEAGAEFLGYLIGSNNASGSSLIGTRKAVRYDSTNHIYGIDSTNSTAALASVVITDVPLETVGDTNGPVVFKFLSTGVSDAVRDA